MSTRQRRSARKSTQRHLLVASPHVGGTPYERQVVLLLQHSPRGSVGVVLNEQFQENLRELQGQATSRLTNGRSLSLQSEPFRVGLVQWGPGKLDAELTQGVWLTSSAKFEKLLGDHKDLWVELVRHIGRSVLHDALGIQNMPSDPSVN